MEMSQGPQWHEDVVVLVTRPVSYRKQHHEGTSALTARRRTARPGRPSRPQP